MRLILYVATALVLTSFAGTGAAEPEIAIPDFLDGPPTSGCRPQCADSTDSEEAVLDLIFGPPTNGCRPQC